MSTIYEVKDEKVFDGMVERLSEMGDQEQQIFMALMQGYQEGVRVGQRIAESQQDVSA